VKRSKPSAFEQEATEATETCDQGEGSIGVLIGVPGSSDVVAAEPTRSGSLIPPFSLFPPVRVCTSANKRGAHGAGAQAVGFGVAYELRLGQVELQVPLQLLADIGGQANLHGPVHDVRVRHGEPP
jgi:hypothetical protein